MKKTILTLSLLVLMAGLTRGIAQQSETVMRTEKHAKMLPEDIAKKRTDHMTKSLALDKHQEKAIYDLNLKHAKEQQVLRAERNAIKKKAEAEKAEHNANVADLLTEEQKAKMEEIRAQRIEKRRKSHHSNPPKPPMPPRIED